MICVLLCYLTKEMKPSDTVGSCSADRWVVMDSPTDPLQVSLGLRQEVMRGSSYCTSGFFLVAPNVPRGPALVQVLGSAGVSEDR